jgi:hypothetical protein
VPWPLKLKKRNLFGAGLLRIACSISDMPAMMSRLKAPLRTVQGMALLSSLHTMWARKAMPSRCQNTAVFVMSFTQPDNTLSRLLL